MIIWSGWGMLSALIGAAAFVLSVVVDGPLANAGIPTPIGVVLVWVVAVVLNWVVGKRLNGRPGRELIDARTGQRVVLRSRHTLFWIPMQYWSIPMLLLAGLAILGALASRAPKPPV